MFQSASSIYSFSACDQLAMEMPLSGFLFAGGLELAVPLLVSRQSSSPRVGVKTADD